MSARARGSGDTVEASIRITRPPAEVFDFCQDFRNLPRYLGDVESVNRTGSTSWRWVIQGPMGMRTRWTINVTKQERDSALFYETGSVAGIKARWEMHFAPGGNQEETEVRKVLSAPLGKLGLTALAWMGKYPADEVRANLTRLKQVMETGKVTYTNYSAPGKHFA